MVSKATEEAYAARTMETPEGRAFYPYGKSPGYLVDARADRYIKCYLASERWITAAIIVAILQLHWHFLLSVLLVGLFCTVLDRLVYRLLLWHRPRTQVCLVPKDKDPSEPVELAFHEKYRLTVVFFAILTFLMFGVALSSSILDKWLFGLAVVALVTLCLYYSQRSSGAHHNTGRRGG